jgi:hypothetical protein
MKITIVSGFINTIFVVILLSIIVSVESQNEDTTQMLVCDKNLSKEECMSTCGCYLCSKQNDDGSMEYLYCLYPNSNGECKTGKYEDTEVANSSECKNNLKIALLTFGFGILVLIGCIIMTFMLMKAERSQFSPLPTSSIPLCSSMAGNDIENNTDRQSIDKDGNDFNVNTRTPLLHPPLLHSLPRIVNLNDHQDLHRL